MEHDDVVYLLLIVVGLPLLLLLFTGPGMWSQNWGHGFLDKLEKLWKRR